MILSETGPKYCKSNNYEVLHVIFFKSTYTRTGQRLFIHSEHLSNCTATYLFWRLKNRNKKYNGGSLVSSLQQFVKKQFESLNEFLISEYEFIFQYFIFDLISVKALKYWRIVFDMGIYIALYVRLQSLDFCSPNQGDKYQIIYYKHQN